MRKVLLWRQVCVGMSPVVAVPVLRRRGYVCVASGGCAGVAALWIYTGAVSMSWRKCHKCGELGGQTYTLPHLKNLSGSQTSVPFSSSHLLRVSVSAISEPGCHSSCSFP
jgi:hypothetical protein